MQHQRGVREERERGKERGESRRDGLALRVERGAVVREVLLRVGVLAERHALAVLVLSGGLTLRFAPPPRACVCVREGGREGVEQLVRGESCRRDL